MSEFWRGEFGTEYTERNSPLPRHLLAAWGRMLSGIRIRSAFEWGANKGHNLRAIRQVMAPEPCKTIGAEINQRALASLQNEVSEALDWSLTERRKSLIKSDLSFTRGVLIHIPPEEIEAAFYNLWNSSSKYILMAEYFSPERREIPYRGHDGKLWAFDFVGDFGRWCDWQVSIVDYGFFWGGDDVYGQDDVTWFLLEKLDDI